MHWQAFGGKNVPPMQKICRDHQRLACRIYLKTVFEAISTIAAVLHWKELTAPRDVEVMLAVHSNQWFELVLCRRSYIFHSYQTNRWRTCPDNHTKTPSVCTWSWPIATVVISLLQTCPFMFYHKRPIAGKSWDNYITATLFHDQSVSEMISNMGAQRVTLC